MVGITRLADGGYSLATNNGLAMTFDAAGTGLSFTGPLSLPIVGIAGL
ncbi:MAG: hypothetical protein NVSMB32_03840 [Actinomycetota bacterium]